MRSGRYKHKIIIEQQVDREDGSGMPVDGFNKVFSAKVNFRIMSGSDLLKAGIALTSEVATMLMRYDRRLDYDHVINRNGNRYSVDTIKPDDNNREMIVTVSRELQR